MGNQILNVALQSFSQTREEVESDYHELLVGQRKVLWVSYSHLSLVECLSNKRDAALKDWLTVRQKARLKRCGH